MNNMCIKTRSITQVFTLNFPKFFPPIKLSCKCLRTSSRKQRLIRIKGIQPIGGTINSTEAVKGR